MVKKIDFIIVLAVAFIGVIVGSFLDLQISENLYFPNNAFGLAMSGLGEAPIYALLGSIAAISFMLGLKIYKKVYQRIILWVIAIATCALSVYFQADHFTCEDGFNIPNLWYVGVIVALVIVALGFLFGIFLFKNSDTDHLLRYVVSIAFIAIFSIVIVQVTKIIMDRPRYRLIVSDKKYSDLFCQWWERGSEAKDFYGASVGSDEFKSFPSGHTNMGALLIPVMAYLPLISNKIKVNSRILFYGAFAYTLLLAFSRITVAAHFLSDVSFGLLITAFIYWLFDFIFIRHDKAWKFIDEKVMKRESLPISDKKDA